MDLELHLDEVDGVRVIWANVPGPFTASLLFGVGRFDEVLPRSGITHLLEHLALHDIGRTQPHLTFNGYVNWRETGFVIQGRPDEAAGFLTQVTTGLSHLPSERIEVERDILRSEASSRSATAFDSLLVWRYGTTGPGASTFDEYGLLHLDADAVVGWASSRFNAASAVLWLSGPPPAGLKLHLGTGPERAPRAGWAEAIPARPCCIVAPGPAAGVAHVRRSYASSILGDLVAENLLRELRYEANASYSPAGGYEPISAQVAQVYMSADAVSGREQEVTAGVLEALASIADGRFGDDGWTRRLERVAESMVEPGMQRAWLQRQAARMLDGEEADSFEQSLEGMRSVTRGEIQEAASSAASDAVYRAPEAARSAVHLPVPSPWSGDRVTGPLVTPVDPEPENPTLVVGPDGITYSDDAGVQVTVLWDRTAMLLVRPTGHLTLVGHGAERIGIKPWLWTDGRAIVDHVRKVVPRSLWVPWEDDPPEEYPRRVFVSWWVSLLPQGMKQRFIRWPRWLRWTVGAMGWVVIALLVLGVRVLGESLSTP